MKDKVIGTNPPVNQTSAITNEITIVLGAGPETRPVPDVTGQTARVPCRSDGVGLHQDHPGSGRQHPPGGPVIGTDPPAGQVVPVDTVIQMQVSRGNQFIMPDLRGMFWADAEPRLRALGWTGVLTRAPTCRTAGSAPTPW